MKKKANGTYSFPSKFLLFSALPFLACSHPIACVLSLSLDRVRMYVSYAVYSYSVLINRCVSPPLTIPSCQIMRKTLAPLILSSNKRFSSSVFSLSPFFPYLFVGTKIKCCGISLKISGLSRTVLNCFLLVFYCNLNSKYVVTQKVAV